MRTVYPLVVLAAIAVVREIQFAMADGPAEPMSCLDKFTSFEFSDRECLVQLAVQFLNIGVMAGSFTYKLPQILKIFNAGDVTGVSATSLYVETLSFATGIVYHYRFGNPLPSWGENLIILAQNIVMVIQVWAYSRGKEKKSVGHIIAVVVLFCIVLGGQATLVPTEFVPMLFTSTIPLGTISRVPQIYANFAAGHTGQLSFITLFLGFAGSAARVFTSMKTVKDPQVAFGFGLAVFWNLVLVLQVVVYWSKTNEVLAKPKKE